MSVTFTTNLGLAKPDLSEIAKNWVDTQDLIEDNNTAYTNAKPVITTYTPTLIASTTNPVIGTGTDALSYGRYATLPGNLIFGWFTIIFDDPGISAGSGTYAVVLPFPANTSIHSLSAGLAGASGTGHILGEAYIRDNSTIDTSMSAALELVNISDVHYVRFNTESYTGKTNRFWTNSQPFTVADGDKVAGNFMYKKAA